MGKESEEELKKWKECRIECLTIDVDKKRAEEMLKLEQAEREAKEAGQIKMAAESKAAALDPGMDGERLICIDQHESRQAELAAKPLRPFLMYSAIPALSDALVELCRANPADPIEFLAAYLEAEATRDFLAEKKCPRSPSAPVPLLRRSSATLRRSCRACLSFARASEHAVPRQPPVKYSRIFLPFSFSAAPAAETRTSGSWLANCSSGGVVRSLR